MTLSQKVSSARRHACSGTRVSITVCSWIVITRLNDRALEEQSILHEKALLTAEELLWPYHSSSIRRPVIVAPTVWYLNYYDPGATSESTEVRGERQLEMSVFTILQYQPYHHNLTIERIQAGITWANDEEKTTLWVRQYWAHSR